MAEATGTFTVSSWDESTYQELAGAARLSRASVAFTLAGDITGEATWEALMCYRDDGGAEFTGLQRVQGSIGGVEGSFVLRADGEYTAGEARSHWQVVAGSGAGGLAGLTGSGKSVATATPPGTYTLEYELG